MIDLINLISEDNNLIIYRPSLRVVGKSVTGTILLSQIIYRWDKNKRKPFYKFKEPCLHEDYRDGDSWCEELGFSKKEFDSALKNISFKVTAKTKNEDHEMPIEFWTKQDRKTYYNINEVNLQKSLNGIFLSNQKGFRKGTKGDLHYIPETNPENNTNTNTQNEFASEFNKFWELYGKKKDRKKCETKWKYLTKDQKAKIFETLPKYVKANQDIHYRKNPLTYLNGECWNDDIIPNKPNNNPYNRQTPPTPTKGSFSIRKSLKKDDSNDLGFNKL